MADKRRRKPTWSQVKATLKGHTPDELLALIRDLYRRSPANRRFLHARCVSSAEQLDEYRRLVAVAIAPDPLGTARVSLQAAKQAIRDYAKATKDRVGTAELMVTFVEEGTDYAADLGYCEDRYLRSLESMLEKVAAELSQLPEHERSDLLKRLDALRDTATLIGYGYGDVVDDVVSELLARLSQHQPRDI